MLWWNPVVYFFKESINYGVEIGCNKKVCSFLRDDNISNPMETLMLKENLIAYLKKDVLLEELYCNIISYDGY